jgi:hypothetical protein
VNLFPVGRTDELARPLPPSHWPHLPEGKWWACSAPERPDDGKACYHDECVACWIAFEASARLDEPDVRLFRFDPANQVKRTEMMVEARLRNMRRLEAARVLRPSDEDLVLVP